MDVPTFLASYLSSGDTNGLLADAAFRENVYRQIHPTPEEQFVPLLREMFNREMQYRADDTHNHEHFENLYWNAMFLFQIGDFDDVIPMWRAKHINMDTGCGFDIQFLVGRGVTQTLEYLSEHHDPECAKIAEHITRCRGVGDFDNLDEWLSDRLNYFG